MKLVAFDKADALTEGRPELTGTHAVPGFDGYAVLRLVAPTEQGS